MLYVAEPLRFTGARPKPKLRSDSTACFGTSSRSCVGKVRRLEMRAFWLQQQTKLQKLEIEKRATDENISDVGAKALDEKRRIKFGEDAWHVRLD